LGIVWSR